MQAAQPNGVWTAIQRLAANRVAQAGTKGPRQGWSGQTGNGASLTHTALSGSKKAKVLDLLGLKDGNS